MQFNLRNHRNLAALACLGLVTSAATALSPVTTFDLEDQAATFTSPPDVVRPGALTSLTMVKDGLTLTLARDQGASFDIVSNTGTQVNKPEGWGLRSLDPFINETMNDAFIGTFSAPVNGVSVEFGDYGQDADEFILQAYDGPNGTGNLLGTSNVPYGTSAFAIFGTGNVAADGIQSIRFVGGSTAYPHSVFYDNIRVSRGGAAIPETGSLALLAGGLLPALGFLRRRTS